MTDRLQVRLHRVPLPGVDVHLVREIRDAMVADLAERVEADGGVPASLRFLSAGLVEEARLSEMSEADPEQIAAFFHGAAARRGVVRSFRVGAATVNREPVAAVLELCSDGSWWAAWGVLSGSEQSVSVSGSWMATEGTTLDTLVPALRHWVDPGTLQVNEVAARWLRRDVPAPPRIAVAEVPLQAPVTGGPLDLLRTLGPTVDRQVLEHGLPGVIVLVFRGSMLERWDVLGALPCSIDDLVRGACGSVLPDAAAVVYGNEVTVEGERLSGVVLVVERGGARARRVLPIAFENGSPVARQAKVRDLGVVALGEGWIGVQPESRLELIALAAPLVEPEA